jgi:hypothetical protein
MPSQIIKYHPRTTDIALLFSPESKEYWIGEYSPFCTHQSGEPDYIWVAGSWTSLEEADLSLILWM